MPFKIYLFLMLCCQLATSCNKPTDKEDNTEIVRDTFRYATSKLVVGADLSYVNTLEEAGATFFDSTSKKVDPFIFLYDQGANLVRVRLWHTPSWQTALYGYQKYGNLTDVAKTIKRAKEAGMAVCLDLHYSDNWADPSKQETPAAWQNLSLPILKDSIYNYTTSVLNYLKSRNLTPEYIQIGNENNAGMCHPMGRISNVNYSNFGQLLASGIAAVRTFSNNSAIKPQIILHVAQLQNANWWATGVTSTAGITDFDILGVSHYFLWSTVNKNNDIKTTIADLKSKFKKQVMVVETAYPWTAASDDGYNNIISGQKIVEGYSADKAGQLQYMIDLTQSIIDGGGNGIIYWEPCWVSSSFKDQWNTGSSWENNTFFDFNGRVLPVTQYMKHKYNF